MLNLDELDAFQVLYLTTMGRITGQPRTIEIWFVGYQRALYVLAEHYHQAQWVKNITMNPLVNVRIGSHGLHASARLLDPAADSDSWLAVRELSKKKYGWDDGLPVQLTPLGTSDQ
jgi:deazaflavin-dependent oxidoreductase (nitroreductase family)